ncbi:MAG: four helix bundle protein [Patescibacteria group bacterium]|nr:four helix bundle protein [Patescibacteria group bacterium]
MGEIPKSKPYNLEERTFEFSKQVAVFCKNLPKTQSNYEYTRQVIRSSGSVGANYIEANEALSSKDFLMRIKICRKEAKETAYWIGLIIATNDADLENAKRLYEEAIELKKIFSSIAEKTKKV